MYRRTAKMNHGVCLLITALLLVGVGATPLVASTFIEMPTIASRVQYAALVFEGKVRSKRTLTDKQGQLQTEYTIDISETWLGRRLGVRKIIFPGGIRADGSGTGIVGIPMPLPGQELLLFLSGKSKNGIRLPVGGAQGYLEIVRTAEGKKRLKQQIRGVHYLNPKTHEVRSVDSTSYMDYEEVVSQIKQAVQSK